jgi:cell division protease FtsH
MNQQQKLQTKFSIWYFIGAIALLFLLQDFVIGPLVTGNQEVSYDEFRKHLADKKITEVNIKEERIVYKIREDDGDAAVHNVVRLDDPNLTEELLACEVKFMAEPPSSGGLTSIFGWVLPLLPLLLIWYLVFRRMGKGPGNILSMGKSRATEIEGGMQKITFDDVGGIDEVETELKELISFLKSPEQFTKMGAQLPKGVLLVGPPGTGKTLVAKATAGEADVPFFALSGSDFVEMFVGVGAARTRDLFEQAKAKAPCIIFIDEIDAIGQSRASAGAIRTNDEREQTLNQLLHEMDGFEPNQGVVIMGATNRPEVLDKALLRAGRFDRQIVVPLPAANGRLEILKIHSRDVPLHDDVDLERLAKITPGFSGADLANIVNEAALLAVRHGRKTVTMDDFDLAIERVVAGLQRNTTLNPEVRRRVAFHEGGHALVAELLPTPDTVHKVSIIPTSKGALGYTLQVPEEDQFLIGEQELRERLAVLFGGRAAELIVYNEASSGAANDMEKATTIARRMVTEFGMNKNLGPVRYAQNVGMGDFLGGPADMQEISPQTAALIDQDISGLIDDAQTLAIDLLTANRRALDTIAEQLQEHEVISGDEVKRIADEAGRKVSAFEDA